MYPKRKTVIVEYWDCGIDEHRHKDYQVAIGCVEKTKSKPIAGYKSSKKRNIEIARAVLNGQTCKDAALAHGLSTNRIRQILYRVLGASLHPNRFDIYEEPPCSRSNINEIKKHKEYWNRRIHAVAKFWGVE